VPILASLRQRGHHVTIFTLADELGHLDPLGIEAFAIDALVELIQIKDWQARWSWRASLSVIDTFIERARYDAADLTRAIATHDPDVLLIDINCWGAAISAEASELPWAMYSPYLLPLSSRDAPPFGLGLRPTAGLLGKTRDAILHRAADGGFARFIAPALNQLRTRHGLPPLTGFDAMLERPPLLLALTAEGFEYPRSDWPANVRLVGPMQWAPPQAMPPWLLHMRGPIVLVTCSSEYQRDARMVEVALQALPPEGISVIATTAANDPRAFNVPRGSKVVRYAPHEAILERAVCAVCHGGMGITQKALAAGVPVVAVPFGRDQHETARRVEVAQAGVRLHPRRLTPDRLLASVQMAIDRRAGAQRVSHAYAAAGGAEAAADACEALA